MLSNAAVFPPCCSFSWHSILATVSSHTSTYSTCYHAAPVCNFCCEKQSAESAGRPMQGQAAWQSGPLTHRPKVWPGPNPILAPAWRHRCQSGFKATDQQQTHHLTCPIPFPFPENKRLNVNSRRHLRASLLLLQNWRQGVKSSSEKERERKERRHTLLIKSKFSKMWINFSPLKVEVAVSGLRMWRCDLWFFCFLYVSQMN